MVVRLLLENITLLAFWLLVVVLAVNAAFLLFILYRRLARARYYKRKDLARAQFAGSVKEFVDGSLRLEDAAVRFQQARSRPA